MQEEKREGGTHDQAAERAVFDDLGGDDSVGEEGPEERGNGAGVDGGEDGEGEGALFEDGARGEELERQRKEVHGQKRPQLNTTCQALVRHRCGEGERECVQWGRTDGGFATIAEEDEEDDEEDAGTAHGDVGDVGYRAVVADEGDPTLGVDADGG